MLINCIPILLLDPDDAFFIELLSLHKESPLLGVGIMRGNNLFSAAMYSASKLFLETKGHWQGPLHAGASVSATKERGILELYVG